MTQPVGRGGPEFGGVCRTFVFSGKRSALKEIFQCPVQSRARNRGKACGVLFSPDPETGDKRCFGIGF